MMEIYIESTQYRIWLIITNGDITITGPEVEWTDDDDHYGAQPLEAKL